MIVITLKLQNAQKDTEAYQTRITEDGKRLKSLGENNVAMQKQLALVNAALKEAKKDTDAYKTLLENVGKK